MNQEFPVVGAVPVERGRTRFCVWAPRAERLALVLTASGRRVPMTRDQSGYHTAETDAGVGTLYMYEFEDGERRPDPASLAQPAPEGVHGASMVMERNPLQGAARFSPPPLERHVIYELHVGAFTQEGTFDAIIPRLDDLQRLGVTTLELMPVAQFPGERNWGYDGVGVFAAQWSYGGLDALRRLVSACHEREMAVILDVVYNHVGPEGNYLGEFGEYFSDRYQTPWGGAINFDGPESDHVREFFIQSALHWVMGCGVDGLRLDAVHAICDRTAQPFLLELGERVHSAAASAGRRAMLIAESSDNDPRLVRLPECGGMGLDGCWNDDFHHALRAALTGESRGYYGAYGSVGQVAKCVRDRFVFAGEHAPGFGRRHGAPALDVPHGRLVVFTQNHDQVGNRPLGDRLDELAGADGARIAAGLVLLGPFTPLLWMGEEYAEESPFQYFVHHSHPELIEGVRRGRRAEFAEMHAEHETPDPQDPATFERSRLRWESRATKGHAERIDYYTTLLRLRRELDIPALSRGVNAAAWESRRCIAIAYPGVVVAANTGRDAGEIDLEGLGVCNAGWHVVLDSGDVRWGGDGAAAALLTGAARLLLPARTLAVVRRGERT